MSVFLKIERRADRDSDAERLPIEESHLEAVARSKPSFRVLRQDGVVCVRLLSNAAAVLHGDVLVCQLQHGVDVDLLTDVVCELAALIPDAIALDEERNVLRGRAT